MAFKLDVFGFFVPFCELEKRHLVFYLMLKNLGAVEIVFVAKTLLRRFVMVNHFLNLVAKTLATQFPLLLLLFESIFLCHSLRRLNVIVNRLSVF